MGWERGIGRSEKLGLGLALGPFCVQVGAHGTILHVIEFIHTYHLCLFDLLLVDCILVGLRPGAGGEIGGVAAT